MKHLSGLTELRRIELSGTKVTDAGIVDLAKSKQLDLLSLAYCEITDGGLKTISDQFSNLSRLTLDSTDVTDAGLEHLKTLGKLILLRLRQTKVTSNGVAALQNALPNCKIEWGEGDAGSEDALSEDPMPLEFEDADVR